MAGTSYEAVDVMLSRVEPALFILGPCLMTEVCQTSCWDVTPRGVTPETDPWPFLYCGLCQERVVEFLFSPCSFLLCWASESLSIGTAAEMVITAAGPSDQALSQMTGLVMSERRWGWLWFGRREVSWHPLAAGKRFPPWLFKQGMPRCLISALHCRA